MSRSLLTVLGASALALALTAGGCARRGAHGPGGLPRRDAVQVARMASRDLGCPGSQLTLTMLNARVVQAHGCGRVAEYAMGGRGRPLWSLVMPLVTVAANELGCGVDAMSVAAPSAEERRVRGCGTVAIYALRCSLDCQWTMTGRSVAPAAPAPTLAAAPVGSAPVAPRPMPLPPEDESEIPAPPVPGSAEAVIRSVLDGHREALRGCASGPLELRVAWTAEGVVAVRTPPAVGPTIDTCVQSELGTLRLPPRESGGELTHLVF